MPVRFFCVSLLHDYLLIVVGINELIVIAKNLEVALNGSVDGFGFGRFVDEGFDSLDDRSLEQALNELTEGNRLIGIISHVAELKKIDR